jgi:PKHD-type hydroxylase|tara:strand:+ start:1239 stop:1757 length:519 start_codon:yes stop_codon:yes gene_type:complete
MNYRDRYVTVDLNDDEYDQIKRLLAPYQNYDRTTIENVRDCEVSFVENQALYDIVLSYASRVNEAAGWNFDIDFVEPLQLTQYKKGNNYDWHQDESEWHWNKRPTNKIRKISFTLLLNDDFTGGDFHLISQPVPMTPGQMIFFHSDDIHKVAHVEQGIRNSLVGWIQGPAWR